MLVNISCPGLGEPLEHILCELRTLVTGFLQELWIFGIKSHHDLFSNRREDLLSNFLHVVVAMVMDKVVVHVFDELVDASSVQVKIATEKLVAAYPKRPGTSVYCPSS